MDELGSKLKEARQKLSLSIDDISEHTKIRPHIIEALEDGNYSILPPVYAKSFLRTYCSFLHIPETEITPALEEISKQITKESNTPKPVFVQPGSNTGNPVRDIYKNILNSTNLNKIARANIVNYIIYLALGLASFALLYFALFSGDGNSSNPEVEVSSHGSKTDTAVIDKNNGLISHFEEPDSIILEAKATDTAWVRVEVDGKSASQIVMVPQMERRWSAKDYFMLSIGNVGAVRFIRNGKILEPLGSKGTVIRNVKITRDRVESSSAPWSNPENPPKPKQKKIAKKYEPPKIEPSPIVTQPYKPRKKN